MDVQTKYNKIIRALSIKSRDMWDTIRNMLPLENSFQTEPINDEEVYIVPNSPDFQLPNAFLRTKKSPSCQKFIDVNRSDVKWDQSVERILEAFDNIGFHDSQVKLETKKCNVDLKLLGEIIFERYGI